MRESDKHRERYLIVQLLEIRQGRQSWNRNTENVAGPLADLLPRLLFRKLLPFQHHVIAQARQGLWHGNPLQRQHPARLPRISENH